MMNSEVVLQINDI